MTPHGLLKNVCHALLAMVFCVGAHATDLSGTPLNTYNAPSSSNVKPNIMFILDNSGSMSSDYMPDTVNNWNNTNSSNQYTQYGQVSSQCNGVYYNPSTSYKPPVDSTGASYANASFTGAWIDGYKTSSGSYPLDLSKNFDNRGVAAYYYRYSGTQTTAKLKDYNNTNSTFYKECNSSIGSTPGSSVFTKVTVGAGEQQNFANWYSYYRTRMLMMKTASGLAFGAKKSNGDPLIDQGFRVGFMTINTDSTTDFLNIADFTAANKSTWYTALYTAKGSSMTPLRTALSDVGQMYAGQTSSINGVTVTDPLQYSCQQNYTILSTDGFWNTGNGYKLNGSTEIGNEDAALPRPYFDGGRATIQQSTSDLFQQSAAQQLQKRTGALQQCNNSLNNCNSNDWSNVNSCTWNTSRNSKKSCRYSWGGWSNASSCTMSYSTDTSNGTTWTGNGTDCQTQVVNNGAPVQVNSCTSSSSTTCYYSNWSSPSTVASCTSVAQSTTSPYTVGHAVQCTTVTNGGSTDSLADVAAYYYNTDLRDSALSNCTGPVIAPATTANDLCANNVPSNGRDVISTQHMTTFTVGLGTRGRMVYSPTYWSDTSGDFWDVWKGTTANSSAGICSWQTSGACNWPTPNSGAIENVDDLWHASVNGHGAYFAATDPDSLATGLSSLLTTIINTPRPGTAAAAASSNPNISSSDNYVFSSSYKSVEWFGELIRQQIDAMTGTLTAQQWSAMTQLDAKVASTRTIYTNVSNALTAFQWSNLASAQKAYFQAPYLTYTSTTSGLSQFCASGGTCLSSAAQSNTTAATGGAAGESLINFLRGDRTNETSFYRARTHVLGDIVSSEARYVKAPMFNYGDAGYSAYKTAQANRTGMVYVAANDGMLHAFDATTGGESWAYIPSFVLPNLYKLADKNYSNQHQFFVDGSPEVGDIYSGSWKTILVGGLNDGGKGYYALNITDPANPTLLWEFTNANMGYTYGNPRITKLADGTWVVIVTSGYNNADGLGHLYVLNANSGALIRDIATTAGSAATPSGLARITTRMVSSSDNTVKAAYGGDLLGNLWRFDVNGNIGAAGYDAQLLVSFKDANGNAQPITAKPTTATINGVSVVYVGTGIYLGVSDVASTSQQTFYAVKDKLDATTYGNPRTAAANNFVAQTLTTTTCPTDAPDTVCTQGQTVRGISATGCQAMDWSTNNGWYVDFLTGGERSTTDSALGLGTLVFTTNIPNQASASACGASAGADSSASFAYAMDYQTGCSVLNSNGVAAVSLGSGLATKPILGILSDGTVVEIIRQSGGSPGSSPGSTDLGNTTIRKPPINIKGGVTKRVSWRELITE